MAVRVLASKYSDEAMLVPMEKDKKKNYNKPPCRVAIMIIIIIIISNNSNADCSKTRTSIMSNFITPAGSCVSIYIYVM
jgi:hypothetical protein